MVSSSNVSAAERQPATREHEYMRLSRTPGGGGLDGEDDSHRDQDCGGVRNGWREGKKASRKKRRTPGQKITDEMMGVVEKDSGQPLPPDYDDGGDCRGWINDRPRRATQMLGRLSRSPGSGGLDMIPVKQATPPRQWHARPLLRRHPTARARRSPTGRRRRASTARDDGGPGSSDDGPGDGPAVGRRLELARGAR